MKSKFLNLNLKDFLKGLLIAILTGIGNYLAIKFNTGTELKLSQIGLAALIAFIAYLTKNLFTNNKDEFLTKDKNY